MIVIPIVMIVLTGREIIYPRELTLAEGTTVGLATVIPEALNSVVRKYTTLQDQMDSNIMEKKQVETLDAKKPES